MSAKSKILVLDDDPRLLELFRNLLVDLHSKPEVITASTGVQAISFLDAEPFALLLCDLHMPKMDGLQVITIVKRRFPYLRTIVMTSFPDEQYRNKAYSMGVDVFLEKPESPQTEKMFLDCIESLLDKQEQGGFRGMQTKTLVDLIQIEALSQSSAVIRVMNGTLEGRIWFNNGEIIDAATQYQTGEEAFKRIMSWKTGNFEIMAAEPDRPRTIEKTHHNLLLETVQAIDEAEPVPDGSAQSRNSENSKFMNLAHREGVEFMLSLPHDPNASFEVYALQDAAPKAVWFQSAMETFSKIGKMLHIGSPTDLLLEDEQIYIALVRCNTADLCIGFSKAMSVVQIHEIKTQIVTEWDA